MLCLKYIDALLLLIIVKTTNNLKIKSIKHLINFGNGQTLEIVILRIAQFQDPNFC